MLPLKTLIHRTNGQIESSGQIRSFLLHVPESYDPGMPAPLVISFHGFFQWPGHLMWVSRWNEFADEYGFVVVYPCGTGVPLRWNTHNWSGSNLPISDEVQFISDLIDYLEAEYNIDSRRIYVNGLSNGGGMAFVLACRISERIAAVGSVSGAYLMAWEDCQPSRPMPLIVFHGTSDRIVPYQGTQSTPFGSSFPALPTWVLKWALHNECNFTPLDLPINGNIKAVQYVNDSREADVVFYTIYGGGHGWPGGNPLPKLIVGHTTQEIDATRLMWDFFQECTLS